MEDILFSWDLWFLKFSRTMETGRESLKPVRWFDYINGVYTEEKNMRKNVLFLTKWKENFLKTVVVISQTYKLIWKTLD